MTDILGELKGKMSEVIDHLKGDLAAIRTGRANASLVDTLMVSYYQTMTPLQQLASITVPDATSIVITPWDKQAIGDIEQAIRASSLGLSPINEGQQIRLVLPALTEQRRLELARVIHEKGEAAKVALRTLRKEVWEEVQRRVKSGEYTEDDKYRFEEDLNKTIEGFNRQADDLVAAKQRDVKTV